MDSSASCADLPAEFASASVERRGSGLIRIMYEHPDAIRQNGPVESQFYVDGQPQMAGWAGYILMFTGSVIPLGTEP